MRTALRVVSAIALGAGLAAVLLIQLEGARAAGTCNDKCADTFTVPEIKVCDAQQVSRMCIVPGAANFTILCAKCFAQEPQHPVVCSAAGTLIHHCCRNKPKSAACFLSQCTVTGPPWVGTCTMGSSACGGGSSFQYNEGTCEDCIETEPGKWDCPTGV
jgi:hypothetical protein